MKNLIIVLIIFAAALTVGVYLNENGLAQFGGNSPLDSRIGRPATTSAIHAIGTGVYTAMATNTNRIHARICNVNNGGVYLGYGFTPVATGGAAKGEYVPGRTCITLSPETGLFTSAVYATASSTEAGGIDLTVIESN